MRYSTLLLSEYWHFFTDVSVPPDQSYILDPWRCDR